MAMCCEEKNATVSAYGNLDEHRRRCTSVTFFFNMVGRIAYFIFFVVFQVKITFLSKKCMYDHNYDICEEV